ncbi:Nn.00g099760.m01.CDS01 [Neocucurbitaria sp. VM-36]
MSDLENSSSLCMLCEHYTELLTKNDCRIPDVLPDFEGRWFREDDKAFVDHLQFQGTNGSQYKSRFVAAFAQQLDDRWAGEESGLGPVGHERWRLMCVDSEWPPKHAFRFNRRVDCRSLSDYKMREYGCRARVIQERLPVKQSDFTRFSTLLDDCLQNHTWCKQSGDTSFSLPRRVIDVGDDDEALPHLWTLENEQVKYATLTHCWGGSISFTTTLATLEQRQEGMLTEEMPKTFREAVFITRRLGLRYLWIDALCIIQDSSEDWTSEAGKMAGIYALSTITISPLNSVSSETGVFNFETVPELDINDDWTVSKLHRNIDDDVRDSPLNRRAWCLQERLFATTILHIGREQLFFECKDGIVGEDGSTSYWAHQLPAQRYGPPSIAAELHRTRSVVTGQWTRGVSEMVPQWHKIVSEYQYRLLTVGADKLPAIAALAASFQEKSKLTYIAGLWEEYLHVGLCWGPYHPRLNKSSTENPYVADHRPVAALTRPKDRVLPSWSWASVNGRILFKGPSNPDYVVEFEEVDRALVNDFLGPEASISLTLTAWMADMYYRLPEGLEHVGLLSMEPGATAPAILENCVMDVDRRTPCACTAVLVGVPYIQYNKEKPWSVTFLILRPEAGRQDTYARVGICTPEIAKESKGEVLAHLRKRRITLI